MADPVLHAGRAPRPAELTLLPVLVLSQRPGYRKHGVAPSVLRAHAPKPFLAVFRGPMYPVSGQQTPRSAPR